MVLQVVRGAETVVGDDVEAVPGQNQTVGVLVAGAGVEAGVGRVQALNQQPSAQGQEPVFSVLRKLGDERRSGGSCLLLSILSQTLKSNKTFSHKLRGDLLFGGGATRCQRPRPPEPGDQGEKPKQKNEDPTALRASVGDDSQLLPHKVSDIF